MAEPITLDEWLAELERVATPADDEGYTVRELVDRWGMCRARVERLLGEAKRRGRLTIGHKTIEQLNGVRRRVCCYRITPREL